jgi:hypothetical protein
MTILLGLFVALVMEYTEIMPHIESNYVFALTVDLGSLKSTVYFEALPLYPKKGGVFSFRKDDFALNC